MSIFAASGTEKALMPRRDSSSLMEAMALVLPAQGPPVKQIRITLVVLIWSNYISRWSIQSSWDENVVSPTIVGDSYYVTVCTYVLGTAENGGGSIVLRKCNFESWFDLEILC